MSLEFVCSNGCGVCKIRLSDFEVYRSETLAGELIERRTVPRIVSACCGFDVDVWDERVQDVTGSVSVEPIAALAPASPQPPLSMSMFASVADYEAALASREQK